MSKRSKLALGATVAVVLLAGLLAATAFAQGNGPNGGRGWGNMMGGRGRMGSGMMGEWGQAFSDASSGCPFADQNRDSDAASSGCPMANGGIVAENAKPIAPEQAVQAVQQYLQGLNNQDLELGEVMEFSGNFYAQVKEKSTGTGAFELLVNRYSGAVHPEPGPNMMWNTKYGHMSGFGAMMGTMRGMMGGRGTADDALNGMMGGGGMMGGLQALRAGEMTVTQEQARENAQAFLDDELPGAKLADDTGTFYGYYTIDFVKDGKTYGMLSVNGYTGQVWYHTWHGEFIGEMGSTAG